MRHLFVLLMLTFYKISICGGASEDIMACLRQERAKHENPSQNIVTVTAENPAYLHCRVSSHHEVAWTRVSDAALLTAGNRTFTRDPRWQVSRKAEDIWVLNLRRAELTDTGCYLCEVNDKYSTVYAVFLSVQEPPPPSPSSAQKKTTRLMANMAGDEVLLNCTVTTSDSGESVDDIVWTRNGDHIDFNNTEKYVWKAKRDAGVVVQTLRIRKATMEDDGDYACEHRHQKASQIVHINKAEAQRSSTTSTTSPQSFISIFSSLLFILLFHLLLNDLLVPLSEMRNRSRSRSPRRDRGDDRSSRRRDEDRRDRKSKKERRRRHRSSSSETSDAANKLGSILNEKKKREKSPEKEKEKNGAKPAPSEVQIELGTPFDENTLSETARKYLETRITEQVSSRVDKLEALMAEKATAARHEMERMLRAQIENEMAMELAECRKRDEDSRKRCQQLEAELEKKRLKTPKKVKKKYDEGRLEMLAQRSQLERERAELARQKSELEKNEQQAIINKGVAMMLVLLLAFLPVVSGQWNSEELAMYDLIEESGLNFYEFYGVAKAYRKLSLEYHPDRNRAEDAVQKFQQVTGIYDVLKSKDLREKYDNVLEFGMPNWRQPVFYFRRMRKLAWYEGIFVLLFIGTIAHYFMMWANYFEKSLVYKDAQKRSKKKEQKKETDEDAARKEALDIYKPKIFELLPVLLFFGCCNLFKDLVIVAKSMSRKENDEEKELLEEQPRPKRINPSVPQPVYEFEVARDNKPVSTNDPEAERKYAAENEMVSKTRKKYPAGTPNRWEQMGRVLNRSPDDVISMAGKLKQMKQEEYTKLLQRQQCTAVNESSTSSGAAKAPATSAVADSAGIVRIEEWSQAEQKAFEQALQRIPKGVDERWERISEAVGTKTKKQCMQRFKDLMEMIKKKKLEAQ
ncbi:unnamed protein product [Caenorhabditis auriculariae]|uniref:DnaJ homolog subfamily C member 2 n=1 Tax=Caenorhabditis auriculariae TaxID=2777116 RepID=A0A8S1GR39_9PELO|nr:unnamed protein product [Caenorhabditis auriculariae]